MNNQRRECEELIKKLTEDMEKAEEQHKNVYKYAITAQKENIERIGKNLKVLEKIEPISSEI